MTKGRLLSGKVPIKSLPNLGSVKTCSTISLRPPDFRAFRQFSSSLMQWVSSKSRLHRQGHPGYGPRTITILEIVGDAEFGDLGERLCGHLAREELDDLRLGGASLGWRSSGDSMEDMKHPVGLSHGARAEINGEPWADVSKSDLYRIELGLPERAWAAGGV